MPEFYSSIAREWIRHKGFVVRNPRPYLGHRAALIAIFSSTRLVVRLAKWRLAGVPVKGLLLTPDRFELLSAAVERAPQDGLWLEFGVWKGESITHIAQRVARPVFGFDSFEGLPADWTPAMKAGFFGLDGVMPALPPNVTLIKGWFDQTLPGFVAARSERRVALLHVDCDLYTSTQTVLHLLRDRISVGTVIVFDEFCGFLPDDEARAWREFSRTEGVTFRWIGCSLTGSVALQVTSITPGPAQGPD